MAEPLHLVVHGDGRVFTLEPGARLTAGRAAQCEIPVEDQAVSRRHCAFEWTDGGVAVRDLESANGTVVNDQPVVSTTLAPGDLIRIGGTVLELRTGEPVTPQGSPRPTIADTSMMNSVVRRRFDPAQFEWLAAGATSAGADVALLRRAARHLTTLHDVSASLATARDMTGVSATTLRSILEVTGADRAAIVLRRAAPDTDSVEVAAAQARDPDVADARFTVSRTLVADVIEKGLSTFAHDASTDARFSEGQSVIQQRVRSVMCVPLRTTDEVLGALYVDSLSVAGRFNESDLELLAAVGNQAGVALHRVRLMGELERLLLDTIKAIAATIDAKDGYTHRHSERVAALSKHLAGVLGMSAEEQETVELSALLHDVGKIAVPDSILNKPGRLTPEEFDEIKKHPAHGARILANIQSPAVKAVLPGVRYHHEKWDGSGYPDGLSGENIPLLGRLLGVADFFDALTSSRSYRPAMSMREAVRLIETGSGTHFDPALSSLVADLYRRQALLPPSWDTESRQL